MLKKANNLETRAKQKEEFRKDGDEEAVNLYIGSIQAKLALLEKFWIINAFISFKLTINLRFKFL